MLKAIGKRDVRKAIVRVRLQLRADQDSLLNERVIRAALAEAYDVAGISKDIDMGVRTRLGAVNVESLTPIELLERYFQVSRTPEVQVESLLHDAQAIIREVDGLEAAS